MFYFLAGRQSTDLLKIELEVVRIHLWRDSYTFVSASKHGIYNGGLP